MNTVNMDDGKMSGSMGDRIRQRQAKAAKEQHSKQYEHQIKKRREAYLKDKQAH